MELNEVLTHSRFITCSGFGLARFQFGEAGRDIGTVAEPCTNVDRASSYILPN